MYEAVIQLLEEGMDMEDIRVSTITERAGIGKGTAYEYFDTKDEIVACAVVSQIRWMFGWLEEQLEKIVSGNAYYNWPILSLLFKSAFYVWGLLMVWIAFLFRRQKKQAILCLFPLLYMGTLFLGPVVQIRYVFPAMLVLPVMACLLLEQEDSMPASEVDLAD